MARLDRRVSRLDALTLEYKLLVTGKIVPDTGGGEADVETRLREIEKILLNTPAPAPGRTARLGTDY